jgi:hypothetical protein
MMAMTITQELLPGFKGPINVRNSLNQMLVVNNVPNSKDMIMIMSGPKNEQKSIGRLVDVHPGPIKSGYKKISVVILTEGRISHNSPAMAPDASGRRRVVHKEDGPGKYKYKANAAQRKAKMEKFQELAAVTEATGKDLFVPYMAGLLGAAEKAYAEFEPERLHAISNMMNSGHAMVDFHNIVQPYGESQYIAPYLMNGLAPVHNTAKLVGGNYNSNRAAFKKKYPPTRDANMMQLIGGAEHVPQPHRKMKNIYEEVYDRYDSHVDAMAKLRADEIAFSASQILQGGGGHSEIAEMLQLTGGEEEPRFQTSMYWNSIRGGDDTSAHDFFHSQFIIGQGEEGHYDNAPEMPSFLAAFLEANS